MTIVLTSGYSASIRLMNTSANFEPGHQIIIIVDIRKSRSAFIDQAIEIISKQDQTGLTSSALANNSDKLSPRLLAYTVDPYS